jgi:hypothetical protein
MGELRMPFFLAAVGAVLVAVLVELGATLLLGAAPGGALAGQAAGLGVDDSAIGTPQDPPGLGVRYLALVDVILLYTVGLIAVGTVAPERLTGRLQGIVTLVGSIVLIIVAIVLLLAAIALVLLMVTLVAATPFGTIAYVALFGFFPRGAAGVLLSLVMFLKIAFCVLLVLAQPRFIQNKGLVALVLTSLVATLVVSFLHGVVPGLLVSITDTVAAIVLAVVAIIWGVVLLIGSIPSVLKAIKA